MPWMQVVLLLSPHRANINQLSQSHTTSKWQSDSQKSGLTSKSGFFCFCSCYVFIFVTQRGREEARAEPSNIPGTDSEVCHVLEAYIHSGLFWNGNFSPCFRKLSTLSTPAQKTYNKHLSSVHHTDTTQNVRQTCLENVLKQEQAKPGILSFILDRVRHSAV